jgi:hypothetical protein
MLTQTWPRALLAFLVSLTSLISFAAFADPPGRVARLADYAGELRVASSHSDWQPAYRNHVITAGDNVWVSEGGRAELDVGPLQVWLSGGANVYFERFDDHNLMARLASGSIAVRIRQWESRDAMRVATEHGEVSFVQPGLYFVSAGGGSYPSVVSARFGRAELDVFGRLQAINRGDTVAFDRGGARFDRYAYSGSATGGFEGWVLARDRRIDRWEARNRGDYDPWMIGVRDLDDHGYWETSYEYGRVWYPRSVSYDWAPYRNGRWTWVQPWGWTWVDDAPWGFAPFHYGRWVRVGGRWAWCPGSYAGRAVYAPALVSFYGGGNWSVSVSTGPTYSWVPLGWNEPFVPWYTYSPNYWRHVNRPYVRNVAEDPWRPPAYIHANVPGAVTSVAAATLIAGRHISQNYVRNAPQIDLRSAPPARMNEVIPQFRGTRGVDSAGRPVDAKPMAVGAAPNVVLPPVRSGVVSETAPNRSAAPAVVGQPAPVPVQPNRNVAEVRVWQDPNPVAARPVAPQAAPVRGSVPAVVRENAPPPVSTVPAPVNAAPVVRESSPGVPNRGIPERQYQQPQVLPEARPAPGNTMQERSAPPVNREKKPMPVQEFRGEAPPRPQPPVAVQNQGAAPQGAPPVQPAPVREVRAAPAPMPAPQQPPAPPVAVAPRPAPVVQEQLREAKIQRREEAAQRVHDHREQRGKVAKEKNE